MKHDWMIRTLEDLEAYATANNLPALAGHLEEAKLLAFTEIASRSCVVELHPVVRRLEKIAGRG